MSSCKLRGIRSGLEFELESELGLKVWVDTDKGQQVRLVGDDHLDVLVHWHLHLVGADKLLADEHVRDESGLVLHVVGASVSDEEGEVVPAQVLVALIPLSLDSVLSGLQSPVSSNSEDLLEAVRSKIIVSGSSSVEEESISLLEVLGLGVGNSLPGEVVVSEDHVLGESELSLVLRVGIELEL